MVLPEDGVELRELLGRRVGAQVLVALEATVRRDEVVEEAGVVRLRGVLVRVCGDLVLLLARDAPLPRGDRGVLAHREPGSRLGVARDLGLDLPRAQAAEQL